MAHIAWCLIDDFCDDPDSIRTMALGETYRDLNETGLYSAYMATAESITMIESVIGCELETADRVGTGRFNYKTTSMKHRLRIHPDGCDWAGILYLNNESECQGGTTFWKHKESGLTHWPQWSLLEALGFKSQEEAWQKLVEIDGLNPDAWQEVCKIPMAYNRLLLFQGRYFHAHTSAFGDSIENARLTQNFFFNET